MKQSHTPTPWVIGVKQNFEVRSQDLNGAGDYVGEMYSHSNAAHIVRCVNAHDKLTADLAKAVAALRGFVAQVEASNCQQGVFSLDYERARAVLAEVESNEE